MRFKRSQGWLTPTLHSLPRPFILVRLHHIQHLKVFHVRSPYQSAAQVWDERIGSARVQAKNWRLMAFGCLMLALLMVGGLVWR